HLWRAGTHTSRLGSSIPRRRETRPPRAPAPRAPRSPASDARPASHAGARRLSDDGRDREERRQDLLADDVEVHADEAPSVDLAIVTERLAEGFLAAL